MNGCKVQYSEDSRIFSLEEKMKNPAEGARRKWTKVEEETMLRYYGKPGIKAKDIALELKRTSNSIHAKAIQMGLTTEEDKSE